MIKMNYKLIGAQIGKAIDRKKRCGNRQSYRYNLWRNYTLNYTKCFGL